MPFLRDNFGLLRVTRELLSTKMLRSNEQPKSAVEAARYGSGDTYRRSTCAIYLCEMSRKTYRKSENESRAATCSVQSIDRGACGHVSRERLGKGGVPYWHGRGREEETLKEGGPSETSINTKVYQRDTS